MSAIPTIWFLLKLLWTHHTHLGNYASCNAGLTCQHAVQGQPWDWPSCDKSSLTSSKLIWPAADCWQLIILAVPSSKKVRGRREGETQSQPGMEGNMWETQKMKWIICWTWKKIGDFCCRGSVSILYETVRVKLTSQTLLLILGYDIKTMNQKMWAVICDYSPNLSHSFIKKKNQTCARALSQNIPTCAIDQTLTRSTVFSSSVFYCSHLFCSAMKFFPAEAACAKFL